MDQNGIIWAWDKLKEGTMCMVSDSLYISSPSTCIRSLWNSRYYNSQCCERAVQVFGRKLYEIRPTTERNGRAKKKSRPAARPLLHRIKYSNYTHFSTSYSFGFSQRNLCNGITPWDSTAYTLSGLCWMVFACLFVTKFSLSSPICTLVTGCCQSSEILQSVAMQIYLGVSHHIVFTSYSSAHFWISKGAKV